MAAWIVEQSCRGIDPIAKHVKEKFVFGREKRREFQPLQI